jgi:hypothetical protein
MSESSLGIDVDNFGGVGDFASSRRYGIKMSERHFSNLELFLGRFCI